MFAAFRILDAALLRRVEVFTYCKNILEERMLSILRIFYISII